MDEKRLTLTCTIEMITVEKRHVVMDENEIIHSSGLCWVEVGMKAVAEGS